MGCADDWGFFAVEDPHYLHQRNDISQFSTFPIKLRNPCPSDELPTMDQFWEAQWFCSSCGGEKPRLPLPAHESSPPFPIFPLPPNPAPSIPAAKWIQQHKTHPGYQAMGTQPHSSSGGTRGHSPAPSQHREGFALC